jgi:hypothetical protein
MWEVDVLEDVVPILSLLTRIYWIFGGSLYSLKFFSETFNELTSYGKLQPRSQERFIYHRHAFRFFYILGIVFNAFVMLFECFLVSTDQIFRKNDPN